MSALVTARLSNAAHLKFTTAAAPVVHYPARLLFPLVLTDLAMFAGSASLAGAIVEQVRQRALDPGAFMLAIFVSALLWVATFERAGFYRESLKGRWWDEIYWVTGAVLLGLVPQLLIFSLVPQLVPARPLLVLAVPSTILTVSFARWIVMYGWQQDGQLDCRVAVVGEPQRVRATEEILRKSHDIAVLGLPVQGWGSQERPLTAAAWFGAARAWHADRILFTEVPAPAAIPAIAMAARDCRIEIAFAAPRVFGDLFKFDFDSVGRQGVIVPTLPRARRRPAALIKRAFDIAFALAGLLVFGIPMLAAAAAIFLESGGPVLLRQQRVGRDGVPFDMLKFRSMSCNAEEQTGAVWATAGDCRTTPVGRILRRTSLDELPQIFNVLKGEMSIVGPRPERPVFVERFRRELPRYDNRHAVLPGITGWSHVYMKRTVDASEIANRLEHDLFYIEHWSVVMDLAIVCKTACEFLFHSVAA